MRITKTTPCLLEPPKQRDLDHTFLHCHLPGSFPQWQDFSFFISKTVEKSDFYNQHFLIKPPYSVSSPCTQNHTPPRYGYFVFYVTMLSSSSDDVQLFYGTLFSHTAAKTKNAHPQTQPFLQLLLSQNNFKTRPPDLKLLQNFVLSFWLRAELFILRCLFDSFARLACFFSLKASNHPVC